MQPLLSKWKSPLSPWGDRGKSWTKNHWHSRPKFIDCTAMMMLLEQLCPARAPHMRPSRAFCAVQLNFLL